MKPIKQTIVRLSILCYLVMTSIAAAHAFPMLDESVDKGAVMVTEATSGDSQVLTSEAMASSGEMEPDCHKSSKGSSDTNSMTLCKIFCSATANAVTPDIAVDLASNSQPAQVAALRDNFQTRQLVVEKHPPK